MLAVTVDVRSARSYMQTLFPIYYLDSQRPDYIQHQEQLSRCTQISSSGISMISSLCLPRHAGIQLRIIKNNSLRPVHPVCLTDLRLECKSRIRTGW